jgi:hypothetical protein
MVWRAIIQKEVVYQILDIFMVMLPQYTGFFFNVFTQQCFIMETCGVIWNEINKDKIHYKYNFQYLIDL